MYRFFRLQESEEVLLNFGTGLDSATICLFGNTLNFNVQKIVLQYALISLTTTPSFSLLLSLEENLHFFFFFFLVF